MKKDTLSRAQLDSMSTTELISLCDEYGISVPDDLNRLFIIGELLEASMESQPYTEPDIQVTDANVIYAEIHSIMKELKETTTNE